MKKALLLLCGFGLLGSTAWADSIVYSGTVDLTGTGFGSNPRTLTFQSHSPSNPVESGCIAPGLIAGITACAPGDGVLGGNEANPIGAPKQSAPTLSSLGITSGSQLGIIFDGIQSQSTGGVASVNDLTLKLYNGTSLIYQVSGSASSLPTLAGNGQTGFLFTLDSSAVAAFNAAVGGNFSDAIALDSTVTFPGQSSGADSYLFANLGGTVTPPTPTPEPSSLALLGTALAGSAAAFRRRMLRS